MVAMMPPADDVGLVREPQKIALDTAVAGLKALAGEQNWVGPFAQGRLHMIETILSADKAPQP